MAQAKRQRSRVSAVDETEEPRRFLRDGASQVTHDAVAIVGEGRLHELLRLDGVDSSVVGGVRDAMALGIRDATRRKDLCDEVRRLAESLRDAVETAVTAEKESRRRWKRATEGVSLTVMLAESRAAERRLLADNRRLRGQSAPVRRKPGIDISATGWGDERPALGIVEDVRWVTTNVEAAATRIAGYASADAKHLRKQRPRADDKGARDNADLVQRNLLALWSELRAHDAKRWTVCEIARLILASIADWQPSPCPGVASRYEAQQQLARGRNRQASPLEAWITTNVSRAKRKRA